MNELQIFNNEEFGQIRTVTIDNEPWFVGKDVAEALGYERTADAIRQHVEEEDKLTRCFADSGQNRQMFIINESGLYALIFGSKLDSAKRFKHWVTSEVLPAIRRTGGYQRPMTLPEQIQILAQGHIETEKRINKVEQDLEDFKNDMPLLGIELQRITWAKNHKVVPLLGGKKSEAYQDASLRSRVYRDVDKQLKREFGVNTYKAIKRNQCDLAISIINKYELPMVLQEEIDSVNSQMSFAGDI